MPQLTFPPKSKRFIESTKDEVIFSGGYGATKSVSLCAKIVFLASRYPRNRVFIGRKILADFMATTYKTLMDGDGSLPAILPKEFIKEHNKTLRSIKLLNDSEIVYGPVEVEAIRSYNLSAVGIDECGQLTEEEWDALNGRLRLAGFPTYQIFGATNPYSEFHWIYNRFVVNPMKNQQGQPIGEFIQSATSENPYLTENYLNRLRNTLFGHYYQRYFEGKWVGADSLVFENFYPKNHIIRDFEIPKHWKRFRAIDFGYRSPFTCGWYAVVAEPTQGTTSEGEHFELKVNDIILYREMYYTQRTATVNAQKVKEFSVYPDGTPEKIQYTVCDHDAGDRADFEAQGIKTIKANKKEKDKSFRIQKIRQRLGNPHPQQGQQKIVPSYFLFENSLVDPDPKIRINVETGERNNEPTRTSEEFMAYSWKPSKEGAIKDEPEDKYDHAMDRDGYFFAEYDSNKQWREMEFLSL